MRIEETYLVTVYVPEVFCILYIFCQDLFVFITTVLFRIHSLQQYFLYFSASIGLFI